MRVTLRLRPRLAFRGLQQHRRVRVPRIHRPPARPCALSGLSGEFKVSGGDSPQIALGRSFDTDQTVIGVIVCGEQFIEFQMNGDAVLVLALLDQEDHQESDNGGVAGFMTSCHPSE